jgi:hypothetical protein
VSQTSLSRTISLIRASATPRSSSLLGFPVCPTLRLICGRSSTTEASRPVQAAVGRLLLWIR